MNGHLVHSCVIWNCVLRGLFSVGVPECVKGSGRGGQISAGPCVSSDHTFIIHPLEKRIWPCACPHLESVSCGSGDCVIVEHL